MRAATHLRFVKAHPQRDNQVEENDPGICLMRDSRDRPRVMGAARRLADCESASVVDDQW